MNPRKKLAGIDKINMLSIIIVSWNVRDRLKENLTALFKSEGDVSFEVFVVDNNSQDKTTEMVKKEFPQVKLIANAENFGFAKANNQAIKQAQGEFILLLNPDMRVFPDTLAKMAKWMRENGQADVAGCHLIDEQGNTIKHVRRFPTIWDQMAIVLKLPHLFPKILNKYLRVDFDYTKSAKVDSVRGGFFMFRLRPSYAKALACEQGYGGQVRRGIELPLLDERYFVWFEEVDFCRQVCKNGREVWYTPAAECIDYVGQSFKQLPRGLAQSYFKESMLKYFRKWQPNWQYWLLKIIWPLGIILVLTGEKFRRKSKVRT